MNNYLEKIANENRIVPPVYIDPLAKIGINNIIGPNVIINKNVVIGSNNYIGSGAVIGAPSRQRLRPEKWESAISCDGIVKIGNNNLIFEYVTIHEPIVDITLIENYVSIGAHTHVGHDVTIRSHATLSVNISLGGYVIVGNYVNIGMGVNIHPRSVSGNHAMLGLGAAVKGYILPGAKVAGVPAKLLGLNTVGLHRHNVSNEIIQELHEYIKNNQFEPMFARQIIEDFKHDCTVWATNGLKNLEIR